MERILIYFFMGISLSMDAFSLAISIGTTNPSKRNTNLLSITIGIFHFIMPLLGNKIGLTLRNHLWLNTNYLTSFIFFVLAIQMFQNRKEEEKVLNLKISTILLIALTVSIDSLTVGFAFGLSEEYNYMASTIFMCMSTTFTYIGLLLGKRIQEKYQDKGIYLGILIMFLISLKYLFFS